MINHRFISIEGVEGAGKSVLVDGLKSELSVKYDCVFTREPGGTPLAELWRNSILQDHQEPVEVHSQLLVMFAARFQHWQQVIMPALTQGKLVVSDRFIDASCLSRRRSRG